MKSGDGGCDGGGAEVVGSDKGATVGDGGCGDGCGGGGGKVANCVW